MECDHFCFAQKPAFLLHQLPLIVLKAAHLFFNVVLLALFLPLLFLLDINPVFEVICARLKFFETA
jgi:hypothetical protein